MDDLTPGQDDDGYLAYCEFVQEDGGAFYQIGEELFVVNGWDTISKTSKSTWHHLQRSTIGEAAVIVCRCPLAKPYKSCIHVRFLKEFGEELFPTDIPFTTDYTNNAALFFRQELEEGIYINHFSAPSPNSATLAGRVVVQYTGDDTGGGRWLCGKDSGASSCSHINCCRDMLQKLVQIDPSARDTGVGDGFPRGRRVARNHRSVSHLPIAPPPWAALDSDPILYPHPAPLRDVPEILELNATSTCCCTEPRQSFNPQRSTFQQKCTIYGLFRSWETMIELQACTNSTCHHHSIGPDCRERGIFNYNNRRLFTHDLLDEYTASYTSSETPFSAWVLVVSRRYELYADEQSLHFPTAEVFRSAWFSYVQLQYLEGDMMCPQCGESPENTIWDGVTLAFNRKHLLPTLEPPTVSQPGSVDRNDTRYLANQQLLPNRKTRQLVRRVLVGKPLTRDMLQGVVASVATSLGETEDEEDEEDDASGDDTNSVTASSRLTRAERAAARARAELLARLEAIPLAVEALDAISPALSKLFNDKFGETRVLRGDYPAPEIYRKFFIQISAEESVLQMLTAPAMDSLEVFVRDPSPTSASSLVEIPIIHELLRHEKTSSLFSQTTIDVCHWMLNRGRTVLNSLTKGPQPPRIPAGSTGCCYGLPKIRERPRYPKLKHDINNEVGGKRGAKCSKFYSQYGERRLTGGIMCVWCTHSICYGFHCIPRGEGRNDVFSALITRWETAPKRVIYDFACALGPYCMTREPDFFSKTQFLIDDFHAQGHTKCSPAAFLKSHCNVDPRLSYINSSAGECGNSGLARIRKSVSYMSQARAILYTKVFLSIWNRLRIKSLC
ncbi:hypothetical protein GGX14DRAFT_346881 [Mycena pura]|uniref:HMG domain-containing protein n=1 Tax=Mycena pura TaxID=153505 RepID=A0AAD7E526_9AGAR|nr:hypothetical protein GGX14DRAFT_346881 [Mycena pura]